MVKIYAKVNFLEIGSLCNFRVLNEETGPKIGMYWKNQVGKVRFKNFDFLVKVKGLTYLKPFFFFFFLFAGGSDSGQSFGSDLGQIA